MMFSTKYQDNDIDNRTCAVIYPSGWWYRHCHCANPNGKYLAGHNDEFGELMKHGGVKNTHWNSPSSWLKKFKFHTKSRKLEPATFFILNVVHSSENTFLLFTWDIIIALLKHYYGGWNKWSIIILFYHALCSRFSNVVFSPNVKWNLWFTLYYASKIHKVIACSD